MFNFKWLRRPASLAMLGSGEAPWLGDKGTEYLFSLFLDGVRDPLDPDPLWEPRYGGGKGIRERSSGNPDHRLWAALNSHRRTMARFDAVRKHQVEELRVFTDVLILVSEAIWKEAAQAGGMRLAIMADKLRSRHQRDFSGQLCQEPDAETEVLRERRPRYCVMPLRGLAVDRVVCQFGLGVFIPDPDDRRVAELQMQYQGVYEPLPYWVFFEDGRRVNRPAGLYATQYYVQVAASHEDAALVSPLWFAHGQGFLRMTIAAQSEQIEAADLEAYGDAEWLSAEQQTGDCAGQQLALRYRNVKRSNESLGLAIRPLLGAAEGVSDIETLAEVKDDLEDDTILRGMTVMFQPEAEVVMRYRLLLVGIPLPRLGPGQTGLGGWRIALSTAGNVLAPEEAQEGCVHLLAFSSRSGLWCQHPEDVEPQPVGALDSVCNGTPFRLLPSPLPEQYYGVLELPRPLAYPLNSEPSVLGRRDDDADNPDRSPILSLRYLDRPGTLRTVDGQPHPLTMNYLGLSASHLELQPQEATVLIRQLSRSSPSYVLDGNGELRTVLRPGSGEQLDLQPGEGLIVGAYLLQFYHETLV